MKFHESGRPCSRAVEFVHRVQQEHTPGRRWGVHRTWSRSLGRQQVSVSTVSVHIWGGGGRNRQGADRSVCFRVRTVSVLRRLPYCWQAWAKGKEIAFYRAKNGCHSSHGHLGEDRNHPHPATKLVRHKGEPRRSVPRDSWNSNVLSMRRTADQVRGFRNCKVPPAVSSPGPHGSRMRRPIHCEKKTLVVAVDLFWKTSDFPKSYLFFFSVCFLVCEWNGGFLGARRSQKNTPPCFEFSTDRLQLKKKLSLKYFQKYKEHTDNDLCASENGSARAWVM